MRAYPRAEEVPTVLGEISADREWFYRAKPVWDKIPQMVPGNSNGYLNAATIYWDYYQYDDALRVLADGRRRLGKPALFGYEAGAIHENRSDIAKALAEYKAAALLDDDAKSRRRLIRLARRPQLRDQIEAVTVAAVNDANVNPAALQLRMELLDAQSRRDDLNRLTATLATRVSSPEMLTLLDQIAREKGFDDVALQVISRQVTLSDDPIGKMSLRLRKARLEESLGRTAAAGATIDALYREYPMSLGIVRATVDYHWRNQSAPRAVAVLVEASSKA